MPALQQPDHEDFPALAAILVQNDQLAETVKVHGHEDADDLFEKLTIIDKEVLAYVAVQRGIRALNLLLSPMAVAAGCWTDGFAAGVQWGQRNRREIGWAYWTGETWHLCKEEPINHERRKRVYLDE